MSAPVRKIPLNTSAEQAWELMRDEGIHHLVVTAGEVVLGVLSDRDLGGPRGAALRAEKTLADLMGTPVVTMDANATVREAARKLRGRGLGCLPVLDGARLVGIVTLSDLLDLIAGGSRRSPSRPGSRRSSAAHH